MLVSSHVVQGDLEQCDVIFDSSNAVGKLSRLSVVDVHPSWESSQAIVLWGGGSQSNVREEGFSPKQPLCYIQPRRTKDAGGGMSFALEQRRDRISNLRG